MTGAAALITSLSLILRLPSRRKAEVSAPVSESSEARQKFANAKAISSDMFFGRESSAEVRSIRTSSAVKTPKCLTSSDAVRQRALRFVYEGFRDLDVERFSCECLV